MPAPDTALCEIIGAIGEPDFASRAAQALCALTSFDLAAVIHHRGGDCAEVLFDNFDHVGGQQGIENYVRSTHQINPMVRGRTSPSVVRARDFGGSQASLSQAAVVRAPDEELGFRTVGWPARQEEIGLYFALGDGLVEIGLYRERGPRPVPARRLASLQAVGRPVAAAFERHQALRHMVTASRPSAQNGVLTPREDEICAMLLAGCSSEAISLRLSISRHTVKDHRKNLFRKLGVSALAELFALARLSPQGGI